MTTPVGKPPTVVTMDDEFEDFLNKQANQLTQKPRGLVKEILKAQTDACIDKTCSPNTVKDISKRSVHSFIDTCVDFSAKKAISSAITNIRNRAAQ